jgi:acetyl-CoA carboxylase biotin carboxyl carrier protein
MNINEKLILTIVDKFSAASIAELDLNSGDVRLVLRKDGAFANRAVQVTAPAAAAAPAVPEEASAAGSAGSAGSAVHLGLPPVKTAETPEGEIITSPIVATYYASPGPDEPAFVSTGTKVKAGDTLCILEAMKMMNRLEAEFDCEIIKSHASNGELVEYGQTLFTVKRL